KVLEAVVLPEDLSKATARGQYAGGWQGGEKVTGFLDEDGMDPQSKTETYAAIKLEIDTRRWAGVPFYVRTGKRLGRRVTEIAVVFKEDRKSTRLNSSHVKSSYAVFCLKKKTVPILHTNEFTFLKLS